MPTTSHYFIGNNDLFFIKPTVLRVNIFEKKIYQFFQFQISFQHDRKQEGTYFAARKIIQNFEDEGHFHSQYNIYFTNEAVFQCAFQYFNSF